jgi:hypothetical protein
MVQLREMDRGSRICRSRIGDLGEVGRRERHIEVGRTSRQVHELLPLGVIEVGADELGHRGRVRAVEIGVAHDEGRRARHPSIFVERPLWRSRRHGRRA